MASLSLDLLHTDEAKKIMRLLLAMKDDSNVPLEYRQEIEEMLQSKTERAKFEFES